MENQNQRSNEETEIDLAELFWVLWRKLPLMIAVGLFTALLVFGGSKFLVTPTYQSVTKIYILNKQDSSNTNVTYSDLQAGTQLVKDYAELIKSRFVLEAVIEQLDLPISYEQLSGKVAVSTPSDLHYSDGQQPGYGNEDRKCGPGSGIDPYPQCYGYRSGEYRRNCKYADL